MGVLKSYILITILYPRENFIFSDLFYKRVKYKLKKYKNILDVHPSIYSLMYCTKKSRVSFETCLDPRLETRLKMDPSLGTRLGYPHSLNVQIHVPVPFAIFSKKGTNGDGVT